MKRTVQRFENKETKYYLLSCKNCVIVKKVTFDGDIKSDYGLSRLLANTSLGDNAAILKATDKKGQNHDIFNSCS